MASNKINVTRKNNNVVMEGDFDPEVEQSVNVKSNINGVEETTTLTFTPRGLYNAPRLVPSDPIMSTTIDKVITFSVVGGTEPINATASESYVHCYVDGSDIEVISDQVTKAPVTIDVSGGNFMGLSKQVEFTELGNMQYTINPSNGETKAGKDIVISLESTVGDADVVSITSPKSLSTHYDAGSKTITVKSQAEVTDTLTISVPGYSPFEVPVTFTAKDKISFQFDPSDTADEVTPVKITVSGTTETITAELDDDRIADINVSGHEITLTPKTKGVVNVIVRGEGVEETVTTVTFTEVATAPSDIEITYSMEPANGVAIVGDVIKITTNVDLSDGFSIIGDTSNITHRIDTDKSVLILEASDADTTTIKISKTGYKLLSIPVRFKAPATASDEIKYFINESENKIEVGAELAIGAFYDDKKVTISSDNKDVSIKEYSAYFIEVEGVKKLVTEARIVINTVGVKTILLTSNDNKVREVEIEAYEVGVNEYMGLNDKTLRLLKSEEKYILGEVPVVDDDLTVESTAITNGSIEVRKDSNRIYVKGLVPGKYFVKAKHPHYAKSTFCVIVEEDEYVDESQQQAKEYFDLGPAPEMSLTAVSVDNLVSKVLEDKKETDKAKLAYILSLVRQYPIYGNFAHRLCQANVNLDSKNDRLVKANGANAIHSVILNVLNNPDYITFKESMKLIKLVFTIYGSGNLEEGNIVSNISVPGNVAFTSDMLTFISKDIAGDLSSININNISGLTSKHKEKLQRYAHKA